MLKLSNSLKFGIVGNYIENLARLILFSWFVIEHIYLASFHLICYLLGLPFQLVLELQVFGFRN